MLLLKPSLPHPAGVALGLWKPGVALPSLKWTGHCCYWFPSHWPSKCLALKFAHILANNCSDQQLCCVSYPWYPLAAVLCIVSVVSTCSPPFHLTPGVWRRGGLKLSGLCRVCRGGVYDQATQHGCPQLLCMFPAWPAPASPKPQAHDWSSYVFAPGPSRWYVWAQ